MKENLKNNLASIVVLVVLLPCLGFYFVADRQMLKEADSDCAKITARICSRLDKLETSYQITVTGLKDDMKSVSQDIGDVRQDIGDIKELLFKAMGERENERRDSSKTYGIDR